MTTTKRQLSFEAKRDAESPYERAAAIWVARWLDLDPDNIAGVDFHHEDGHQIGEYTWEPGYMGLEYSYRGHLKEVGFPSDMTPGRFIEECSAILATLV